MGSILTPENLIDFTDKGGNVMVALSADQPVSPQIAVFLSEIGIYLLPRFNSVVVDHFSYDIRSSPESHDTLLIHPLQSLHPNIRKYFKGGNIVALPKSIGYEIDESSPLLNHILQPSKTSYSQYSHGKFDKGINSFISGHRISLVTSMQSHKSARVVLIGSAASMEDLWMGKEVAMTDGSKRETGNREFINSLISWNFKEVGVLKVQKISHQLHERLITEHPVTHLPMSLTDNSEDYRVKTDVVCGILTLGDLC